MLAAGLALTPKTALACVWNGFHGYNPLPPCLNKDKNVSHRISQANVRLAAKIGLVATKSAMIATEINGWVTATAQGKRLYAQYEKLYGGLQANPLGSLAGGYSFAGLTYNIRQDASGRLVGDSVLGVDWRHLTDSVAKTMSDTSQLKRLYGVFVQQSAASQVSPSAQRLTRMFESNIRALSDWSAWQGQLRDSIYSSAIRNAAEYANERNGGRGISDAKIQYFRNSVARMRVNGQVQQMRGVSDELRALEIAASRASKITTQMAQTRPVQ